MKRFFLILILTITTFIVVAEKPNIIIIFADDLDADEINYTSEMHDVWATHSGASVRGLWSKDCNPRVLTPHIDSLAKNGMLFERFYVNGTVCSSSRYTLLTGRYATNGEDLLRDYPVGTHATLEWRPWILRSESSLPKELKRLGYTTGIIGKWHNGESDLSEKSIRKAMKVERKANPTLDEMEAVEKSISERYELLREGLLNGFGWDVVDRMEWGNSIVNLDWQCEGALNFIESNQSRPFFLYCALPVPHGQYRFDYNQIESYDRSVTSAGILDTKMELLPSVSNILERCKKANVPRVNAMATHMDDYIGKIIMSLEKLDLRDNTLIIFTSDHGSRGKNSVYEGGAKVPMIITWPKVVEAGSLSDSLIGSVDIASTLLEIASGSIFDNRDMDGRSFKWQLIGEDEPNDWRKTLLIEAGNTKGVVSRDWKYIANRVTKEVEVKMKMRPHEVYWTGYDHHNYQNESMYPTFWEADQFFDLKEDLYEQNNLISNVQYSTYVRMMKDELSSYVKDLPHTFGEFGK